MPVFVSVEVAIARVVPGYDNVVVTARDRTLDDGVGQPAPQPEHHHAYRELPLGKGLNAHVDSPHVELSGHRFGEDLARLQPVCVHLLL